MTLDVESGVKHQSINQLPVFGLTRDTGGRLGPVVCHRL